jgi:hypothetical protein
VDEDGLKQLARSQLGRQAAMVGGELRQLADALEPGEEPEALAMGAVGRHGRLVLLTDRRLLLARGWSPLRRGARVEPWPLDALTGVERHALSLHAGFGGHGTLKVGLAPEEAANAITDALRARLGLPDAAPARDALQVLAERKLGAKVKGDMRADLALLADNLAPHEDVQRLALVGDTHGPLLAAITNERFILAHAALRAANDRWMDWPRADVRAAGRADAVLQLEASGEPLPRLAFMDEARCDEFEAVLR